MKIIFCFFFSLTALMATAQNVDSTFKYAIYRIPDSYVLDTNLYSIDQSDNLFISQFTDKRSFYYAISDIKPYYLNLVSKKTGQKISLLKGKVKYGKDITYEYELTKEKEIRNKIFPEIKLYNPDIKDFTIFKPGYTSSGKMFKGKITIIHVWEYGCEPCMEEIHLINDLADSLKSSDIQIIGLHRGLVVLDKGKYAFSRGGDVPEAIPVHFPQYPITDEMMKKVGVPVFPTTYVLDKNGIVRAISMGTLDINRIKLMLQSLPFYKLY